MGAAREGLKKIWGNVCVWRICSLPWLWWWFHGYIHMAKFILCTWNMCSLFYVNLTSKQSQKNTQLIKQTSLCFSKVLIYVHMISIPISSFSLSPSVYRRTQHKIIVFFLNMWPRKSQTGDWLKIWDHCCFLLKW